MKVRKERKEKEEDSKQQGRREACTFPVEALLTNNWSSNFFKKKIASWALALVKTSINW